jgi:hypothetical protein
MSGQPALKHSNLALDSRQDGYAAPLEMQTYDLRTRTGTQNLKGDVMIPYALSIFE